HEEAVRLFKFLTVADDSQTVETAVAATRFEKLSGGRKNGEADQSDSRAHFRKGVSGEWRGEFSAEENSRVWQAAGPLLDDLGYTET
ncbi:MAG: sulfotransferase domain-containing protein, partial [Pseudomonadota bacterium]|nr:sulfotransferase domain-containing protein [Pseudomonadota bacterium]